MQSILVVEDEENIRELITYNLDKEGYRVNGVASGEDGLRCAREDKPDLIVLDLMLPGLSGLDVCKSLKLSSETREIPIVMVSAKGEESDIILGLELGADDYLTKPFSPKILIARVRAVLRRKDSNSSNDTTPLALAGISIDPVKFEVVAGENKLDLTITEFRVLHFLIRHPGWVFTRYQIVDAVKGENYAVTDRSVDVQVVGLRKKLGKYGANIETVRGVGYRFKE